LQLDLSDNQIADELELLCASPNLEFLNLSSNPIKDISSLEALVSYSLLQLIFFLHFSLVFRFKFFHSKPEVIEENYQKLQVGLYRICFWEICPEPDFAEFVKQIRPMPDFTI